MISIIHFIIFIKTSCFRVPRTPDTLHDKKRHLPTSSENNLHETPADGIRILVSATALPVTPQTPGDSFPSQS